MTLTFPDLSALTRLTRPSLREVQIVMREGLGAAPVLHRPLRRLLIEETGLSDMEPVLVLEENIWWKNHGVYLYGVKVSEYGDLPARLQQKGFTLFETGVFENQTLVLISHPDLLTRHPDLLGQEQTFSDWRCDRHPDLTLLTGACRRKTNWNADLKKALGKGGAPLRRHYLHQIAFTNLLGQHHNLSSSEDGLRLQLTDVQLWDDGTFLYAWAQLTPSQFQEPLGEVADRHQHCQTVNLLRQDGWHVSSSPHSPNTDHFSCLLISPRSWLSDHL